MLLRGRYPKAKPDRHICLTTTKAKCAEYGAIIFSTLTSIAYVQQLLKVSSNIGFLWCQCCNVFYVFVLSLMLLLMPFSLTLPFPPFKQENYPKSAIESNTVKIWKPEGQFRENPFKIPKTTRRIFWLLTLHGTKLNKTHGNRSSYFNSVYNGPIQFFPTTNRFATDFCYKEIVFQHLLDFSRRIPRNIGVAWISC